MKIEVVHALWGAEEEVFEGGVHEDVKLTKKAARVFAGAEAAGAIVILEASEAERKLLDGFVQSQEHGEAEYGRAVADGRWQEGNTLLYEIDPAGFGKMEA